MRVACGSLSGSRVRCMPSRSAHTAVAPGNPAMKAAQSWAGRLPVPYSTRSEITFWTSDMDRSQRLGECAQLR
jgi:hypothetical protein